jgi:glycosyltransferase involved in cell wall biosynthesis
MTAEPRPLSIWLITVGEPLPFGASTSRLWRTGLLAEALVARGHDVLWWTSSVNHFEKSWFVTSSERHRIKERLSLQFLHGCLYTKNISLARWRNHRQIADEFVRLAAQEKTPDLIVCSYPTIELSVEAVRYANVKGLPVLLDIRDLWPDEMAARLPGVIRPAAPILFRSLYRGGREALGGASGIVAISRTYLDWARAFGRRRESPHDLFAPMGYDAGVFGGEVSASVQNRLQGLGVDTNRRLVWFCGTFVGSIDLSTVIHAARLLENESTLQFVLTGSGEKDAQLRALAQGLPNVVFTGWANRDELAWLARRAWVGLGAYKKDAMMSLPNKIFEYMAAGIPSLCSLPGEAGRLLEAHDVGLNYAPGDPESLASRIRELSADPQRREVLADNATRAFRQHFAADIVYSRFAQHIEHCVASSAGQIRGRKAAS